MKIKHSKLPSLYKITPTIQDYHWGKKASESIISTLIPIDSSYEKLAELWIGAHPKSPSKSYNVFSPSSESTLLDEIKKDPKFCLGNKSIDKFGEQLPFLLKILSIETALSIQAHPDKTLAELLHARDPKNYPDNNHKPEIGIALEKSQILFGFKSLSKIITTLEEYNSFKLICRDLTLKQFTKTPNIFNFKKIITEILTANSQTIFNASKELTSEVSLRSNSCAESMMISKLIQDYPNGESGLFCALLMELITIEEGEAIFIGANIPHAYLNGTLIECMANSDNVIRCALTPKYKDTNTLLEILDLTKQQSVKVETTELEDLGQEYLTSCEEFRIITYKKKTGKININANAPTILFCLSGKIEIVSNSQNSEIKKGEALFIPAATDNIKFNLLNASAIKVSTK